MKINTNDFIFKNYKTEEEHLNDLSIINDNSLINKINIDETLNILNQNKINLPEDEYKDIFNISNEKKFREPLLIQNNPIETLFKKTNYIYFEDLPLVYPMENKKKELVLTHLTNELVLKYKINVRGIIKSFSKKFIYTLLKDQYNIPQDSPRRRVFRGEGLPFQSRKISVLKVC